MWASSSLEAQVLALDEKSRLAQLYSLALSYFKSLCLHGGINVNNRIFEYTLGEGNDISIKTSCKPGR